MITTSTIKQIRALLRSGLSHRAVAQQLGLHPNTVGKYQNDAMADLIRARDKARWERERADPEKVERRRTAARERFWRMQCDRP